jgi:hypothetical protein
VTQNDRGSGIGITFLIVTYHVTNLIFAPDLEFMIRTITHKGLKDYFLKGEQLPASLMKHEEGLRYWLSILNAVTCIDDLKLSGSRLVKSNPGYKLTVDGIGEFTFVLKDQGIQELNFRLA